MQYMNQTSADEPRLIQTVSAINLQIKDLIAERLSCVWVEGEISNLAQPASGHIYFSLKDSQAQLRCVMFRASRRQLPFKPENGLQVVVRAKASLYEPRGDLQLIVEHMEEAGFGALQRQYEALKKKLHSEGLFANALKQPLPFCPQDIAIITSAIGAALQDFLKVAQRRYPNCSKSIYAVPVQGDSAAPAVTQALACINRHASADVIAIIRGGGSIEDLWAFNDERLALAIAASNIPVVTGIGHEIDFTIADFVADRRAPTPSVAAELICPEQAALQLQFEHSATKLTQLLVHQHSTKVQTLDWLGRRLNQLDPAKLITRQKQYLEQIINRLERTIDDSCKQSKISLDALAHRLSRENPQHTLTQSRSQLTEIVKSLHTLTHQHLQKRHYRLQLSANSMHVVSPLNTLKRGYSITTTDQTQPLANIDRIEVGQRVITHFAQGQIISRVESTSSDNLISDITDQTQKDA